MCGVVVAYAVGGSFFLFAVCGMVVVHRLVFLFLLIFESSFWGSAFCLFGWWAFSRGWGFGGCCGWGFVGVCLRAWFFGLFR